MPPILASLLCFVFIAWLLYGESKGVRTSPALWFPTLLLAITASKPAVLWVYGNNLTVEDPSGNPFDRNILILLFVLGLVTLARRRLDIPLIASQNKALLLLLSYMGISVFWSDYPVISLKRFMRELGYIVMIVVVLTDRKPVEAVHRLFVRCVYVLVPLSILYMKYYPEIGLYYNEWTGQVMYGGVTTNKNTLGLLAMIGALVLIWSFVEARRGKMDISEVFGGITVLLMCLWLLIVSDSKTSLSCFVIGLIALCGCRTRWLKTRPALATVFMSITLLLSAVLLMSPMSRQFVAEGLGRDPSLTTRIEIWTQALELGTNPIFGAGYNSVWLTPAGRNMAAPLRLAHSHNGYLEVYLNLGLIGLALLLSVLVNAFRNASNQLAQGSPLGPLLVALCVSGMVYNYTEVTFNRDNVIYFGLFFAAIRVAAVSRLPDVVSAPMFAGDLQNKTSRLSRSAILHDSAKRRALRLGRSRVVAKQ